MSRFAFPVLAAALLALPACRSSTAPKSATQTASAKEVVGTYRRSDILIAYYKSKAFQDSLQGLRVQRDAALARGDKEAAQALENQGAALQDKAHAQMWSGAPLDNVLAALEPSLPQIKQELGITRIAEDSEKLPAGATSVDATAALINHLPPRL